MKNLIIKTAAMLLLLAGSFACSKNEPPEPKSSEKAILSFIAGDIVGEYFDHHQIQSPDSITGTFALYVDDPGADVSSLVPVITVSPGATVSPASGVPQDFSHLITYTVTAEDGTIAYYMVGAARKHTSSEESAGTRSPITITVKAGAEGLVRVHIPNTPFTIVESNTSQAFNTDSTLDITLMASVSNLFYYDFVGWYVNNTRKETFDIFSSKFSANDVIEAKFEAIEYTITVQCNTAQGTVSISGGTGSGNSRTVAYPNTISFSAVPKPGYIFDGWYRNGITPTNYGATVSNLNPVESANLVAKFRLPYNYTVTVATENANRGTVSGGGTVTEGQSVSISATPRPGFRFDGWYKSGTKVQELGANATFVPTANTTLLARFKQLPPTYYIGGNGSEYSGESTLYASGTGYAGTTLYAYPGGYRYVWSAEFYGECDRWYMWPNGHIADVSVYFNQGDEGGLIRFECAIYNGNTLLSTPTYYLTVLPDGQKSLKIDLPQSIADELEAIRAIRVTEESMVTVTDSARQ